MFDTTQNIAVDGVVTRYDWRNPHVYMTLRVTDAAGAIVDEPLSLDIVETLGSAATEKSATTQVASAPVAMFHVEHGAIRSLL